jgi:hypothetical protein
MLAVPTAEIQFSCRNLVVSLRAIAQALESGCKGGKAGKMIAEPVKGWR